MKTPSENLRKQLKPQDTPEAKKTPLRMKFFYGVDLAYVELNGELMGGGVIDAEILIRILNYQFDLGFEIENEFIIEDEDEDAI